MKKFRIGILGATGMVGQRFVTLLADHPWFAITALAASPRSAGSTYATAVSGRWVIDQDIPKTITKTIVRDVQVDMDAISREVDIVFCALDLDKETIKKIEVDYASRGVAVISNNSAHRDTADIPMLMPEINPDHIQLIDVQRRNRGWSSGLIAVKPNCSIQSYVSILTALKKFNPTDVAVTSLQAISGAGETFESWPEMADNLIPFIDGEEEKSEHEPLKIWGNVENGTIKPADGINISATCIRVPVSDGHLANVSVRFDKNPTREQILEALRDFDNPITSLDLPSAPQHFITYFEDQDRPQTKLDRNIEHGMGIAMGKLRPDPNFDWRFVSLAHNTIRGAAGGAVLMAELLVAKDYIHTRT